MISAGVMRNQTQGGVSAASRAAVGMLLGEIRLTGTLCEPSVAWVKRNASCLAQGDVQRLIDAMAIAQAQLARGVSTGGALVHYAA